MTFLPKVRVKDGKVVPEDQWMVRKAFETLNDDEYIITIEKRATIDSRRYWEMLGNLFWHKLVDLGHEVSKKEAREEFKKVSGIETMMDITQKELLVAFARAGEYWHKFFDEKMPEPKKGE